MTTPTTTGPGASPSTDASAGELVHQLSLRKATPPVPQEAIADVKADVTEIKEGIRR
jgi:hypothetical protein